MKTGQVAAVLAAALAAGLAVYLYRRWSQERETEAPSLVERLEKVATPGQVAAAMTKLQANVAANASAAVPAPRPPLPGAAGQTPGTAASAAAPKLPAMVVKAMAEPTAAAAGSAAAKLKPGVVSRSPMGTVAAPLATM
ncbi:hypothetical protein BO221_04875 [Archangium sp. Cb G35]|uniref:hypothetical protein n=1 Tax=Archangium sp. Cb G35 TaxID=1920190 RepID=UPI0009359F74|nr:hypothetical protein [Archangium sp. Cb G35]OJT27320.1 hypothetical protein BO221_04875 [Archangium sp. Cb G35]